ncbi:Amino-acid acetyltransferase, mitochondrial [Pyricularia oryzae]|nr:Amino-acid acetyltransferase, mitochondrial [Pyricularia oryzae]KAI6588761.1 Amino-acid acetyltransferase, mitochondrial [Pyricularia oryzae]
MTLRGSAAWKQVGSIAQLPLGKSTNQHKNNHAVRSLSQQPCSSDRLKSPWLLSVRGVSAEAEGMRSLYETIMSERDKKMAENKELLLSVMETSPTRRGAKKWLKDFAPALGRKWQPRGISTAGPLPQADTRALEDNLPQVAIVKLREPQSIDETTLKGVGRTLCQLQMLGLLSIVVVDCDQDLVKGDALWPVIMKQTERALAGATIAPLARPRVMDYVMGIRPGSEGDQASSLAAGGVFVSREEPLIRALKDDAIVVVPTYAVSTDTCAARTVQADEAVVALTRYYSGLQFPNKSSGGPADTCQQPTAKPKADIRKVMIIDPLGGPPANNRPEGAHVFLNMIQEYDTAMKYIKEADYPELKIARSAIGSTSDTSAHIRKKHADNLELTKRIVTLLPSSASVVITTPEEAANLRGEKGEESHNFGFLAQTRTRKPKNALIHNLITDRPAFSSSLPTTRFAASKPQAVKTGTMGNMDWTSKPIVTQSRTTLAKRGMPLTILPDPFTSPWTPTAPGQPRLRLTDICVDLPRLVHLIDDSFDRKLDVQDYLNRVEDSLAGIIIVGEYEGGAILTWEAPNPHNIPAAEAYAEAYRQGRLVPYLDKFAVLKRAQGEGGIADIVFNAMIRTCFPKGVCWRSRKDNPVNKWYAERSRGFRKLDDSNWSMFWTTEWDDHSNADYEDVCRKIQPSWADNKQIVD